VALNNDWQKSAELALNDTFTSMSTVGGGDFAQSYCAQLASGLTVFIKTHANPPPGFFTTEANGLGMLRDTGTVNIPDVLAVSDDPPYLVLEWIDVGNYPDADDSELGAALAALHKKPFECFGRPDECTTGSLAVPNKPTLDWVNFYSQQRLLPLTDIAEQRNALHPQAIAGVREIASRLSEWQVNEPPSLLHGDLWAGNRVVDTAGKSWLIDPATHGGSREFDIAMMALFGGYDRSCIEAYHEVYPLQDGWLERIQLHQLAPNIVHAIKFGDAYANSVMHSVKALL